MMLIYPKRYSYDCLSKSWIPIVYRDICKCSSGEMCSRSNAGLILEFNRRYSEILVKAIVRHYDLFPVWTPISLKTYLRITSLFHYSSRTSRMAYDRLITVKHMRAKIGVVPLNFRGVERDEDDYED